MPTQKGKGKVACRACNLRRVRCDRTEETPCSHCQRAGQDCQPIDSQRGKHKRDHLGRLKFKPEFCNFSSQEGSGSNTQVPGTPAADFVSDIQDSSASRGNGVPGDVSDIDSQPMHSESVNSGSGHHPTLQKEDGKTTYYGDSFNYEYVLKEMHETCPDDGPWKSPKDDSYISGDMDEYRQKEHRRLKEVGAFDTYGEQMNEKLIQIFFDIVYPVAPIVDRAEFRQKYETGRLSPLLLQAVCFTGFAFGEEQIYREAGFPNRYLATFTCYQRAKALYDVSYESDAIASIQAMFLLCHWWVTPTDQKETWYWIGLAVNLAQSLGLHQQKTYLRMGEGQRKLWRRIWWTLYIQDIFSSVLLWRTPHVNETYRTVEVLTERDFEEENHAPNSHSSGKSTKESKLLMVYLASLSLQVGKCHQLMFNPHTNQSTILKALDGLKSWKESLPHDLQRRDSSITLNRGYWTCLAHLSYYTFETLLRRNGLTNPDRMAVRTISFDAAADIVRILEDMLSSEVITISPLRIIPSAFASLSVQIANMRAVPADVIEISKHRARLCMLVLSKLLDYWPPLSGYYRLFARILSALGCHIPGEEGSQDPHPSSTGQTLTDNTNENEFNFLDGLAFGDLTSGGSDLSGMATMFPFSSFLLNHDPDCLDPSVLDPIP